MKNYLNFEADIKKLENELDQLKDPFDNDGITEVNTDKITKIQKEIDNKLDTVYSNLNAWEITQVARHENRPKANFYIENLFDDAKAIAPPDPPSPIMIDSIGTVKRMQHSIDIAIASA